MMTRVRRILDIVVWSSVTNLLLLGCFTVGWNFDEIRHHFARKPASSVAMSGKTTDPLSVSRYERRDNELLTKGPQRQLKGPLQITMVPASVPASQAEVASDTGAEPEDAQGDGAGEGYGPEDPSRVRSPVLRKDAKSGNLEIGNFATVSMNGSSADCLDMAYGLLQDAGAPRDRLKVLAESKAIVLARICAANGSLILTCRMDQITLSPRRLKPNESCTT